MEPTAPLPSRNISTIFSSVECAVESDALAPFSALVKEVRWSVSLPKVMTQIATSPMEGNIRRRCNTAQVCSVLAQGKQTK